MRIDDSRLTPSYPCFRHGVCVERRWALRRRHQAQAHQHQMARWRRHLATRRRDACSANGAFHGASKARVCGIWCRMNSGKRVLALAHRAGR